MLYPQRPWNLVLENGHWIGTHSIKHRNYLELDEEEQCRDLSISKSEIESIINKDVFLFRPTFGLYNKTTLEVANKLNLKTVLWSLSAFDWDHKKNPQKILNNILNHVQDDDIILLHELEQTVSILPELLRELKRRGYSLKLT